MFLPFIGFGQCVSGDCQNGYGVFTSEEGTYKGNWKYGKVHGNGMFVGFEYTYDGEYVNGKKHGKGKKTYNNGTIEEGTFKNGEFVKVKLVTTLTGKVVDYGVIEHNSDGVRRFIFKNNGTEPLIIKNAKASCGCVVPTWPREPIAAGQTYEIGVKYATNRLGKFTKTITLTTNASKKPVILTIKGEVIP